MDNEVLCKVGQNGTKGLNVPHPHRLALHKRQNCLT